MLFIVDLVENRFMLGIDIHARDHQILSFASHGKTLSVTNRAARCGIRSFRPFVFQ
jgi:hypothetical protein